MQRPTVEEVEQRITETINELEPRHAKFKKMGPRKKEHKTSIGDFSAGDLRVAERFARPFLDEIYDEAIKKVKLRRVLTKIKKVLRNILSTEKVPDDLDLVTRNVQTELKKHDVLDDVDMNLIANIIHKCFVLREQNICDLAAFVSNVEQQIERINEHELFKKEGALPAQSTPLQREKVEGERATRKSISDRMRSYLLAKQANQENDLHSLLKLANKNAVVEDSDSGSSDSFEDERDQKRAAERDGQLIYMRIYVASQGRHRPLQGTTLDNPGSLASKFAFEHNLGLVQQIQVKKLVQEKIQNFGLYTL